MHIETYIISTSIFLSAYWSLAVFLMASDHLHRNLPDSSSSRVTNADDYFELCRFAHKNMLRPLISRHFSATIIKTRRNIGISHARMEFAQSTEAQKFNGP